MNRQQKSVEAADKLESLLFIGHQIVRDLRENQHAPHARVYWLRRQIGRVVASLGVGIPDDLAEITNQYDIIRDYRPAWRRVVFAGTLRRVMKGLEKEIPEIIVDAAREVPVSYVARELDVTESYAYRLIRESLEDS